MMAEPFSKANLAEIKKALALAVDAGTKCKKAAAAGVDVGEADTRCDLLTRSLQQLLDIYDVGKAWDVEAAKNG
jgi:hypothetical protein